MDRLLAVIIDETGNNVEFDELSTKETLNYLKDKMDQEFKNIQIHLQDGLIKFIQKQKFITKKNMIDEEPTTLLNDRFFQHFLKRFKKLL